MTKFARGKRRIIEAALKRYLRIRRDNPNSRLLEAMRYSVFPGGKRLRAVLVLAANQACEGNINEALPAACAVELVHSFSLVHDDMPCIDNDDYRRGRMSCHKRFGEALALLAGDALLALAFELLAKAGDNQMLITLARAIGTDGMVAGQVAELEGHRDLDYINSRKTGALIVASVLLGAQSAGAGKRELAALKRYGDSLGRAFQLMDDLSDKDGSSRVHSDAFIKEQASRAISQAKSGLRIFGKRAGPLLEIADFVLKKSLVV